MEGNSLEKVVEMDAAFRSTAKTQVFDTAAEGSALLDMMQGSKRDMVEKACSGTLTKDRWEQCKEQYKTWQSAGTQATGAAIKAIVEDLDADHLRPSGIQDRLNGGNCAACHGLASLMAHLKTRSAGSPSS